MNNIYPDFLCLFVIFVIAIIDLGILQDCYEILHFIIKVWEFVTGMWGIIKYITDTKKDHEDD